MDDYEPAPDSAPGKRIAQLLASEIEGHEGRGLGPLSVVDARPEAEPTETGTVAYRVAAAEPVATVVMYPDRAVVEIEAAGRADRVRDAAEAGLSSPDESGSPVRVPLADGAAVKRVLSALAAVSGADGNGD